MAYTPLNLNIYTAAFSGAMAGIGIPEGAFIIDPVSNHYVLVSTVATVFARALDTAWGAVGANEYNVQAVCEASCNTFIKGSGLPADGSIATQANWTITATAIVAMIRQGDIAATTDGIVFPPVDGGVIPHQYWVATWGSDTLGNGTSTHPYQTITYTLGKITDASLLAIYDVILYPGNFAEDVILKPFVNIIGLNPTESSSSTYACCIVGDITLGAGFTGVSSNYAWLTNVTVTGTITFDFVALMSAAGEVEFNNCQLRDDITLTMNVANKVQLRNVAVSGDYTQTGGTSEWEGVSNNVAGTLLAKASTGQGSVLNAYNSAWKGTVTLNQNGIATATHIVTFNLKNSDMSDSTMNIIAAGNNSPVVYAPYGATPENPILSGNATLTKYMRVNVPFSVPVGTTINTGKNDIALFFGAAPNPVFGLANIEYMSCTITMAGDSWRTELYDNSCYWFTYVRQNGPAQELHLVIWSNFEVPLHTTSLLNLRFEAFYDYLGGP